MGIRDKIIGFIADEKDKRQRYEETKYKSEMNELARLKERNKAMAERNKVRSELMQEKKKAFANSGAGRFVSGVKSLKEKNEAYQKKKGKSKSKSIFKESGFKL